jgi:hypothetical protein
MSSPPYTLLQECSTLQWAQHLTPSFRISPLTILQQEFSNLSCFRSSPIYKLQPPIGVLHLTPSLRTSPTNTLPMECSTSRPPAGVLHLTTLTGILHFTSSFRILNLTPSCGSSLPNNTLPPSRSSPPYKLMEESSTLHPSPGVQHLTPPFRVSPLFHKIVQYCSCTAWRDHWVHNYVFMIHKPFVYGKICFNADSVHIMDANRSRDAINVGFQIH